MIHTMAIGTPLTLYPMTMELLWLWAEAKAGMGKQGRIWSFETFQFIIKVIKEFSTKL